MTNDKKIFDITIVGSGPAGLTAGIYNVRADLKTVVIGGNQPGGQLTITTTVDNYPGFANGVGGVKLMMEMQQQAKNLGVEMKNGMVKNIQKQNPSKSPFDKGDFLIELESGETIESRAVIITTGAAAKWLHLPNEKELIGRGISGCATCDGMFFRDKIVAVVGGGDTACEDANFMSKFATKVYMIHRRDAFRASAIEQKKVVVNPKIEIIWDTEIMEINAAVENTKLENIKIKNNKTGEEKILVIDGLFVAIGRIPATGFIKDLVELKETGYIVVEKDKNYPTMTSVPGVFAAGDCVDDIYRQAVVAAGSGCQAGLDAEKWLER